MPYLVSPVVPDVDSLYCWGDIPAADHHRFLHIYLQKPEHGWPLADAYIAWLAARYRTECPT